MSLITHHIFDLDMALSIPATNTGTSGGLEAAKITDSITSSNNKGNRRNIELPIVTEIVGTVCTVCMEGFKLSSAAEVNLLQEVPCCGHVFHGICINKWLSLHNSCPLCRFDIAAV
ncbi:hypothetical protein M9H77_22084 [Catharanthus roseus]|uniref:Uncharacterized protein n=1 Tax=Catharanthus roseus TaxID=4058 RepID=A0ACC0ATH7_CATRO|nr:hypothetical protein M9H77_22084 [Catharanthus roseus]